MLRLVADMTNVQKTLSGVGAAWVLAAAATFAGTLAKPGQAASRQAAASAQPATPAGDASRGKALVESSGCLDCHRINDRGSRLGPDLTDIGARRTPNLLEKAIVAPDEEVLPENRFVSLVTREGVTVTGRLLNQDAISVQLITPKEELKSYLRANLREYTIVDKGLMPSAQGKLTDPQVADIVAYLLSLTRS
jgi:putative heme-binding domain-containing protein